MMAGSRLRKIGWAMVLLTCTSLYLMLHLRVNAVKSEVRLAERKIVALKEQKLLLETEFETRANQQQLADWNAVDFGYKAPTARQFLEGERQLAQYGSPRVKTAPAPIRVASAAVENEQSSLTEMVAPLTGTPARAAEVPVTGMAASAASPKQGETRDLSARLARGVARIALDAAEGGQ